MRKMSFILVVAMLFSILAMPAAAAEPRLVSIIPDLSFDGTTANCVVRIMGNSTNEEMNATIRLYRGSICIATWYAQGNGYIFFSKTKAVTAGYTYKLTVDLTIDGVACTPVYVTGNC